MTKDHTVSQDHSGLGKEGLSLSVARPLARDAKSSGAGSEGSAPDEITESAIRDRARSAIRLAGWRPGDRPGLHSVCELMVAFGMNLTRYPEEARCAHPECGCDFDAVCDAAISDTTPAPAPEKGNRQ